MEFKLDKAAIKLFSDANKPILGICGGLQSINVYFGGSLNQKIENHDLRDRLHEVSITKDTFLSTIYKKRVDVNSYHKQSVKNIADQFIVSARSDDGQLKQLKRAILLRFNGILKK